MRINNTALLRWQQLDARTVLLAIADHAKQDDTFEPTKNRGTTRWHASVGGNEFELLLTGTKFWDTRTRAGGGGAVDLVMHLVDSNFKHACNVLRELQL
jgi:hypothetical protein